MVHSKSTGSEKAHIFVIFNIFHGQAISNTPISTLAQDFLILGRLVSRMYETVQAYIICRLNRHINFE